MLIIQAGTLIAGGMRGALQVIAGERIVSRLRLWCFTAIFKQELAFFDTPSATSGQLVARLGQDAQIIQHVLCSSLLEFTLGVLRASIACVRMLAVSWEVTLMVLAIVPVTVCIMLLPIRYLKKLQVKIQDAGARATNVAVEATGNMRTVISFGSEEFMGAVFNVAIGDIDGPGVTCWWPRKSHSTYRYGCQTAVVRELSMTVATWFGLCILTLIGWYSYDLVLIGKISFGEVQIIHCMDCRS
jgi:ABC-type multidrug transport system fused ATPase/permease subunit